MHDLNPLESVAASELVSSALIASLISTLVEHDAISPRAARDIYESALVMIEVQQSDGPTVKQIYEAARGMLEAHLRPDHRSDDEI